MRALLMITFVAACVVFVFGWNSQAFALRCGTRLVNPGDTIEKVIRLCGEPSHTQEYEKQRIITRYRPKSYSTDHPQKHYRYTRKKTILVQVWTYNFGSTRFIRHLKFENGILKRIDLGDRGY